MADGDGVLAPLDGKSQTLFLVAGGLLVPFAALLGYEAVTNAAAPEDVFGPPGFLFAMLGLLGFYRALADRTPLLSRAGVATAAISAVGWVVITVLSVGETVGALPPLEAFGALGLVVVSTAGVPMVLAYVSFGIGILRTDVHSPTLGLLVLAPPVIFGVMLSQAVLYQQFGLFSEAAMTWSAIILSGGQALAHLAIGYVLRTEGVQTDDAGARTDATV